MCCDPIFYSNHLCNFKIKNNNNNFLKTNILAYDGINGSSFQNQKTYSC